MAAVMSLPQTSKCAKQQNSPPARQRNQTSRTREYLTPDEAERMIAAARRSRGRLASALLIILAYRHGFRASELIAMRSDQIDSKLGTLHVTRMKPDHLRHLRFVVPSSGRCAAGNANKVTLGLTSLVRHAAGR
jgi:integrase